MYDYEQKHIQMLREHLAECTVLLKKNGAFPLERPGTIAAYGSGVRKTLKGGTGSGEVNSRYYVTVEQGLKDAGFTLTSEDWLDGYEEKYALARKQFVKDIRSQARQRHIPAALLGMGANMPEPEYALPLRFDSDAAIYVLSRVCGEANDRKVVAGDVLLTDTEVRDILVLNEKYQNFMLVLNVGGPVDLTPVQEVGNILILSQLGVETGAVLADILLGKANPSGKLTTTWSRWGNYCPDVHFGDPDDTYYREGVYVGYRYFDTVGKQPGYPFGYGLSYSEFDIRMGDVTVRGSSITVSATVQNIGQFSGKETVQLYVSSPAGILDRPWQELAGFAKTSILAPGAKETVSVTFDMRDLAAYDEQTAVYLLGKGNYILRLGNSSRNTKIAGVIQLPDTVNVKQVRAILPKTDFEDKVYGPNHCEDDLTDVPAAQIDPSALTTETVHYEVAPEVLPEVSKMTDEELVRLCIGSFNMNAGALSVIGNASQNVAGAAGESYSANGVPAMVMADGPAGLRLTKEFYRDEKGLHAIGESAVPASLLDFLPAPMKLLNRLISGSRSKLPKGADVKHQYATALPIGTALAQSWNLDFAEKCGDIVGAEMERFGVHLWLAPALNIHRSILCGRNFEYYSEDPLVSGEFAAAVTRGVQKHPGCGTTIKHYAANNQETNRMNNNTHVSERAMREIYLKGFSICIREAQPHAVMSSYNLVNGEHTAESRGLIEDYLRAENGYEGIVMTDWVIEAASTSRNPKYRIEAAPYIEIAGGDLLMPGSRTDYEKLLDGVKNGAVSRNQLEVIASRVIRMARSLHG